VAVIDLVLTGACWAAMTVLVALQLAGAADRSWWWFVAPLWLPLTITGVAFAGLAMLERSQYGYNGIAINFTPPTQPRGHRCRCPNTRYDLELPRLIRHFELRTAEKARVGISG
jgi:hypothetical protein